ncbi:arginine repressor [Actinomyces qiguomingii]|uniref:arginine repressor n=1 Tax=Actinomyces qiguomingii TaxID=2057800 RepID=UPI000CA0556E|nr:arginine repressor [Actinomyces qiguomingii]
MNSEPSQDQSGFAARTPAARRRCIADIIVSVRVHSQAELQHLLAERGFSVSQGTLSRDLAEMRAYKVHSAAHGSVYVIPEAGAPGQLLQRDAAMSKYHEQLNRRVEQFTVSIRTAHSDVVLQTPPGAAQLLAAAIDDAVLPGVMGTIAGDDTILIATKSESAAQSLAKYLSSLTSGD